MYLHERCFLLALFTGVSTFFIFLHQHAITNSHVIMATVSQIATGVMVMMIVETTVMKKDVVQVCTIYVQPCKKEVVVLTSVFGYLSCIT